MELPRPPRILLELVLPKLRDDEGVRTAGACAWRRGTTRAAVLAVREGRDMEVRDAARRSVRAWDRQLSQAIVEDVRR
jgi:hypothetical protein